LKAKKRRLKDTFSEDIKGKLAGHAKEVNSFVLCILKLAEYIGIYPKIHC
jgi:hypothetical protein